MSVFRKYLNYLIDIICEKFIREGQLFPALHVLLNTDENLTKDCVVLASKELMMLLETIPYCDSLQTVRFMKLVECTMKRCRPPEQVPLSRSFPYKRPAREPGLYSQPLLLTEKLESLRLSMTRGTVVNDVDDNSNESNTVPSYEEAQPFESAMLRSETVVGNEAARDDREVMDSIVAELAERTIKCCIELIPGNEIPHKVLCLKTIASSLDVLAMNSKRLLPAIPTILNAVNNELASWYVSFDSVRSRGTINTEQGESLVYQLLKSEDCPSFKQHDNILIPNISLLDGFCEVIVQIIRYTGDFSKATISSVALPKLIRLLKLIVSRDTVKFWESTLYSGYALSSFRCLELITTLDVTVVGGFIEDLVEIVVPILSLRMSRTKKRVSTREKWEQRYEEKLKVLCELCWRILTNLLLTDPSTTWYCFYRKTRLCSASVRNTFEKSTAL